MFFAKTSTFLIISSLLNTNNFSETKILLTQFVPFANIARHNCPVDRGFFFENMITQTPLTTSKKVALTITLPTINFAALFEKAKKLFFSNIYNPISNAASHSSSETISRSRRLRFPKGKFSFNKNKLKVVLPIVFGIIVIAAIVNIVKSLPDAQSRPVDSSTQINAPDALATINLDRKFSFPLKDEKGVVVGNFDYVIESAAIQKQIIVKGQRATAINGREFMLLNLKITKKLLFHQKPVRT